MINVLFPLRELGWPYRSPFLLREDFGGLEIIDENRASVSDFLASIFYARYPHLPKNAASLFYLGLTTDSGRFQFSYSPEVFSIASKLIEDGADVPSIYESIYVVSEASVQFKGYLFSNYQKTFLDFILQSAL